jgi:exodeoxyribonuclease VII large subunit
VDALAQNLAHLNPRAVLTRGYAIVERDAMIVQDARDAPPGAEVRVTFARGRVHATVTRQDD